MELTGLLQMAPFRGMKEEELVAFLFGLPNSLKHFEPGDIIARQGDLCKGLYILASGSVRAGMINDEGKELTVEEIGAPNLLASAFIFATENRFPVNVEAIGPCEVFVIGKERFLEFIDEVSIFDIKIELDHHISAFASIDDAEFFEGYFGQECLFKQEIE